MDAFYRSFFVLNILVQVSTKSDEFLDQVIQDYEAYAKENQRLQMENDRLVSKVDELTKQVAVGSSGQTARPTTNMTNAVTIKNGTLPYFFSKHDHYRHRSLCKLGLSSAYI